MEVATVHIVHDHVYLLLLLHCEVIHHRHHTRMRQILTYPFEKKKEKKKKETIRKGKGLVYVQPKNEERASAPSNQRLRHNIIKSIGTEIPNPTSL